MRCMSWLVKHTNSNYSPSYAFGSMSHTPVYITTWAFLNQAIHHFTRSDQMHHFDPVGHKTDEKVHHMHIKEGTRAKSRYQGLGQVSNTLATHLKQLKTPQQPQNKAWITLHHGSKFCTRIIFRKCCWLFAFFLANNCFIRHQRYKTAISSRCFGNISRVREIWHD